MDDTKAKVLISQFALSPQFDKYPDIMTVCVDSMPQRIEEQSISLKNVDITPSMLAYVIYTSGTTGNPKGVLCEHRNVVRLFFNESPLFDFSTNDVWSMFHSFNFDFSVWEMYGALLFGGKLVMVPKEHTKNPALFSALMQKEQITVLNQTPSAFRVLQEELLSNDIKLPLRYVIFGGEALNPSILQSWQETYSDCKLINMYGITETTVHVTYKEILPKEIKTGISNIGKSIPTLGCLILDDNLKMVAEGLVGEIYIYGAGLARGYLNNEKLTNERFINCEIESLGKMRLYRSGDLARALPNGDMKYIGRNDNQIKIRGYRIELGEIESHIVHLKNIVQAVVCAKGEKHDKYLVAYIICNNEPDRDEIKSKLLEKIPSYMVPTHYVPLQSFPLTNNGKLDRKALPLPNLENTSNYMKPTSRLEERLATIWAKVLGLKSDHISINDSFFDLGGHSLNAIRVLFAIREELHLDMSLTMLYQFDTISALSNAVELNQENLKYDVEGQYDSLSI